MVKEFLKDPGANKDYLFDWGSKWMAQGDTIASATVVTNNVTVSSVTHTNTTVTAWLSGGTAGVRSRVMCSIVTTQGRTDVKSFYIVVQNQ
jgi:hypothetical protein